MAIVDVGINLGGGDRSVAEECLNCSDVGSFFDEWCGEAMSEGVRCDFFGDADEFGVSFDQVFYSISAEVFS